MLQCALTILVYTRYGSSCLFPIILKTYTTTDTHIFTCSLFSYLCSCLLTFTLRLLTVRLSDPLFELPELHVHCLLLTPGCPGSGFYSACFESLSYTVCSVCQISYCPGRQLMDWVWFLFYCPDMCSPFITLLLFFFLSEPICFLYFSPPLLGIIFSLFSVNFMH